MGLRTDESVGMFEALAESATDAIVTIDQKSVVLFANPAIERVFGYQPHEIVGQRLSMLIPERYRAAHDAGIARYLRSGQRKISWSGAQLPGLRKDGTEIPLEISFGEIVNDDGSRVFSGFMRDVSDRVRYQREIEQARANAEATLRDLASIGRIMDMALTAPSYAKMIDELLHGLRQEMKVDEATVMIVDENAQELMVLRTDGIVLDEAVRVPMGSGVTGTVARTGQALVIADTRQVQLMQKPLREEIASLVVVPMRSQGELVGVLHVGTQQPRTFSEHDVRLLETVGNRLAGVMARTRQYHFMDRRRQRAEATVRSRDEVLSIVSHDLRNPVGTVLMAASLINDPEIRLPEAEVRKQLAVIERSARRMNTMIADLHDVARIEGGRFKVQCRLEDPAALASEVFDSFRSMAQEKSLAMKCHVEASLPRVMVDRDRLVQALANYFHNAIKFTPEDGTITFTAAATPQGGVRYAVADTGPGIPQSEVPKVFDRFWQAKRTAHKGSGLGLAIVKGIAQAHGGTVGVDSSGDGSAFWLELPPPSP